jgi:integrase
MPSRKLNIHRVSPSRNFPEGAHKARYRDERGKTHSKTYRTYREAERFLARVSADKQRGDFINPADATAPFRDVAERWSATLARKRKERTVLDYRAVLRLHVLPHFGPMKLGRIAFADVDGWLSHLEAGGLRSGTIRNAYKVLKQALDYAVKDGRIRSNPCNGVALPEQVREEMLFLTAEEIAALVEEIGAPFGTLVKFAAYTGLRAGEIVGLKIGEVDWQAGTVRVLRSITDLNGRLIEVEPKTKAARRTVPVPKFVLDDLRAYVGERIFRKDEYLFMGARKRGPLSHRNFYRRHFRPAVDRLVERGKQENPDGPTFPGRLAGLRFHDLRHTYASLLVAQGAHPKEMSENMGHATSQITLDRYSHLMPHLGAALASRLDHAYAGIAPSGNNRMQLGP